MNRKTRTEPEDEGTNMSMAEVTFFHLHDADDEPHHNFSIDPLPYWAHHDFEHFASDPEFPPSDRSRRAHIVTVHDDEEDDDEDDLFSQYQSTIHSIQNDGDVSDHNSISNPDSLERENQVNFVMDLFQQRVEQAQVTARSVLVSELVNDDSSFGIIDGNCDGSNGLDLDLNLGLGSGLDFRHCLDGDAVDVHEDDDFFVGRRVSGSESGEATSNLSRREAYENCVRLVGFGTDSDEDGVIGLDLNSVDEYGADHVLDDYEEDDTSIPLRWDSLLLDDHRENNEDFEWEEIERGTVDEREVFDMYIDPDHDEWGPVAVPDAVSPRAMAPHVDESVERFDPLARLAWEVLLDVNFELSPDVGGDLDDYIYPAGVDDMFFGQFSENENVSTGGRPPAAISVVENLSSIVLSKEDVDNGNALCAVCRDDMNVGEAAKRLPCAHRYHGDCIVPWLRIRNTCPVCRHELPTDDAAYERRRAPSPAHGYAQYEAPDSYDEIIF